MAIDPDFDPHIAKVVEKLLTKLWDGEVVLGSHTTFREHKCYRLLVDRAPSGCPGSVFVKMARPSDGIAIDPDSTIPNPSHRLLDEWAGLQFLTEIAPDGSLAPRFYGGDRASCIIVYEDLGEAQSLADAVMGSDAEWASEALCLHAQEVARLHCQSMSHECRYESIRDSLGPRVANREGLGWAQFADQRPALSDGFAALGVHPDPGFWDEYHRVGEAIYAPGSYRAYVHNDTCPDNNWLGGTRMRLIDFERGGFHHRLIDAAFARMSMPHCYLASVVPSAVIRRVEQTYREAVLTLRPEVADDWRFDAELVNACFYWTVSNGTWDFVGSLGHDFQWGECSWRQRVLHRLVALAETCEEFGCMPAVARTARKCAERLRGIWTVEDLPLFPAFRA